MAIATVQVGVDIASRVAATLVPAAAEAISRKPEDPFGDLEDISLDRDLKAAFGPALNELGYQLNDQPLLANPFDPTDTSTRIVSAAIRAGIQFYLIKIPGWVVEQPKGHQYIAAFFFLSRVFPKNSMIYMIGRNVPSMDYAFERILADWRVERGITAIFIPWRPIGSLLRWTDLSALANSMKNILKLEELEMQQLRLQELEKRNAVSSSIMPTYLTDDEKKYVAEILSNLANNPFSDAKDYMNNFVASAGLRDLNAFRWQGNRKIDAGNLVTWATDTLRVFPIRHPKEGQSTIGAVIVTLIASKLDPTDARKLAKIAVDHALSIDPESRKSLLQLAA